MCVNAVLALSLAVAAMLALAVPSPAPADGGAHSQPFVPHVALYVLSRGQGVPEEARQVLEQARERFSTLEDSGAVIRIDERRIGLEGETRLCAEFADEADARREHGWLEQLAAGVDLVNLAFEPCQ